MKPRYELQSIELQHPGTILNNCSYELWRGRYRNGHYDTFSRDAERDVYGDRMPTGAPLQRARKGQSIAKHRTAISVGKHIVTEEQSMAEWHSSGLVRRHDWRQRRRESQRLVAHPPQHT